MRRALAVLTLAARDCVARSSRGLALLTLAARDCVARSSRGLAVLALVAAMVVAGCPGSTGDVGTVTPAPVPSQPPPTTDAPSVRYCGVPTPVPLANEGTPRAPSTPVGIPVANGTVNESALLARHERALGDRSYRLTAPGHSIVAAPNGSAYLVDAGTSARPVEHYVVGDRRYTYVRRDGGRNHYAAYPYDGGTFPDAGGDRLSLTGRAWLTDALGVTTHRVATRRPDGWTVLTGEPENETGDDDGGVDRDVPADDTGEDGDGGGADGRAVRALNSTVLVDPHGVVRSVEQRLVVEDDGVYRMATRRFAVTDVGVATLQQPSWVCEAVDATGATAR